MTALLLLLTAAAGSPPERTVFACQIGDRTATVLREGSNLVYRSERRGGVELQLPDGRAAQESFSGGGELQATFRNGPWTYIVYERTIRTNFSGPNHPRFEAGIDVLRRSRVVSRRHCDDADSQFSEQLADVPTGTFIEH